ncbi:hypothetical protein FQZ97_758870 [compost metagenome]
MEHLCFAIVALADNVEFLGVGREGVDAAGFTNGLAERQAAVARQNGDRAHNFAGHEYLAVLALFHANDVAVAQQDLGGVDALLQERRQADDVGLALARNADAAVVARQDVDTPGAVERFDQGHGYVVDVLGARRLDFAVHVDALAAEGEHAYRDLRHVDDGLELGAQLSADFVRRAAENLEHTGIWKLDGARGTYDVARHVGRAAVVRDLVRSTNRVRLRGEHQFRVVPHNDRENVAHAHGIGLRVCEQLLHPSVRWLCGGLQRAHQRRRDPGDFGHRFRVLRIERSLRVEAHPWCECTGSQQRNDPQAHYRPAKRQPA